MRRNWPGAKERFGEFQFDVRELVSTSDKTQVFRVELTDTIA